MKFTDLTQEQQAEITAKLMEFGFDQSETTFRRRGQVLEFLKLDFNEILINDDGFVRIAFDKGNFFYVTSNIIHII